MLCSRNSPFPPLSRRGREKREFFSLLVISYLQRSEVGGRRAKRGTRRKVLFILHFFLVVFLCFLLWFKVSEQLLFSLLSFACPWILCNGSVPFSACCFWPKILDCRGEEASSLLSSGDTAIVMQQLSVARFLNGIYSLGCVNRKCRSLYTLK